MTTYLLEVLLQVLHLCAVCIFFYLPAGAANMAPVFVKKIPGNWPIWQSRLGKNKTWRGLVAGVLLATVVVFIQKDLSNNELIAQITIIPYQTESGILIGVLFGFGALGGDVVKSFFKRRIPKDQWWPSWYPVQTQNRRYPEGSKWVPLDQIDFMIGSTLLMSLVVFRADVFLLGLLVTLFIHPLFNVVGYRLGLKEVPW